jgi:SAM-dependent methyltransferase
VSGTAILPAGPSTAWGGDPYARALTDGHGPLFLRRADGWLLPLEVERWCAPPDEADATLLARCRGAVLDIGCGPGRLVAGVARRGLPVLGLDVHPAAVARTRVAGGAVLRRSVFDRLPAEGRWGTALLADGNIGIGGDPVALLSRVRALLAPGGHLLAEAAAHEVDERLTVRVQDGGGRQGLDFPWARLGPRALRAAARASGWHVGEEWSSAGRNFALLLNPALPGADVRPPNEAASPDRPLDETVLIDRPLNEAAVNGHSPNQAPRTDRPLDEAVLTDQPPHDEPSANSPFAETPLADPLRNDPPPRGRPPADSAP